MPTYAAIDLHSNNGVLTIIDETDRVLKQRRISNNIEEFVKELEPFRATLQGVAVESTFNWYWLVDGLRSKKFPVALVNTALRSNNTKASSDRTINTTRGGWRT
jgi:transposase